MNNLHKDHPFYNDSATPPREDKDRNANGTSIVDIVPVNTIILLAKKWEVSKLELMSYNPNEGKYQTNQDITTINVPSGFKLDDFKVVGFGNMVKDTLSLSIGDVISVRDSLQLRRVNVPNNPYEWLAQRAKFDKYLTDEKPSAEFTNRLRFITIEYLITDSFNVSLIHA